MYNNLSDIKDMATYDVMDVYIFDKDEKLQASLESLLHSKIYQEDIEGVQKCFLLLDTQLYNMDLLNYLYGKTNKSDYERYLNNFTNYKLSINSKPVSKQCKLIATGYFKDSDDNIIDYIISADNAVIKSGLSIQSDSCEVNTHDIAIEIKPDDNDNFYDMYLLLNKQCNIF